MYNNIKEKKKNKGQRRIEEGRCKKDSIDLTYAKQSAFPNSCAQLPEALSSGKPNGACNKSSYT